MGEAYKDQHIVPQAYLNRFAVKRKKQYKIGTRYYPDAKGKPKLFKQSVEDVAYIVKYYDVCKRKDPKYWEHYLDKNFDSLCGTPLGNIIAKITLSPPNTKVLTDADKEVLARIIVSQAFRVPAFLDDGIAKSEEILRQHKQEILQTLPTAFEPQRELIENITFDEEDRKDIILSGVFNEDRFQQFCDVLQEKDWFIFYNQFRNAMPFVTSDNPVVIADTQRGAGKVTSIGLGNDRAVILYPITPSILIGIYSKGFLLGRAHEFENVRILVDDMKFITKVNYLVIRQCHKHSFIPEPLFTAVSKQDQLQDSSI